MTFIFAKLKNYLQWEPNSAGMQKGFGWTTLHLMYLLNKTSVSCTR